MKQKAVIFIIVVLLGALADQGTKAYVSRNMERYESIPVLGKYVRISFVHNRAMAWSLNPQKLFPALPVMRLHTVFMVAATVIMVWYYFACGIRHAGQLASLSLVIAGALGNALDRLRMGQVVDFIDMGVSERLRWPVFNLADSWITIGVILLLLLSFLQRERKAPAGPALQHDAE